jgi:putative membrane protein
VLATTSAEAWRWQPHPEVWLLVAGVVALSIYVVRVIGPKVVAPGEPVLTRRQTGFLVAGILTLWLASDWPLHDLGEEYLFVLHMVQHLLLSYVLPPLFLLATPTWLARLVVRPGSTAERVLRRLSRPLVAGLVFNGVVVLTHWPTLVNAAVESGPLHYGLHVLLVATALLMWMPVCGPFPEWRISPIGQMVYLFAMSIVPTVPAAWLTFAEGSVYDAYDTSFRLWDVSVTSDQQAAGLLMKLGGGFYLWTIIAVIFFTWAYREERGEPTPGALTYDEVKAAFDRAGPAPTEHHTKG